MDNEDFGRNNPPFQHYIPSCYGKYQPYIPSVYSDLVNALSDEAADATEVEKRETSKPIRNKQVAKK